LRQAATGAGAENFDQHDDARVGGRARRKSLIASRAAWAGGLSIGDVHRDFEAEAQIGVSGRRPLHGCLLVGKVSMKKAKPRSVLR
jgi:hypothetical protein